MLFPGLIYIARGLWYFLPNIDEGQKKSYHLSAGPLALCHMVNPALVFTIIKRLDEDLRQQLLGQKPLTLPASSS